MILVWAAIFILIIGGLYLMTTVAEIQEAIANEKAQVQTRLDQLASEIQALKDQLASGEIVTQEQLEALKVAVENIFNPEE